MRDTAVDQSCSPVLDQFRQYQQIRHTEQAASLSEENGRVNRPPVRKAEGNRSRSALRIDEVEAIFGQALPGSEERKLLPGKRVKGVGDAKAWCMIRRSVCSTEL